MVADGGPNLDLMETPGAKTLPIMNPGGEKSCCPSRFREEMELIEPAGVRKSSTACSVLPSRERTVEHSARLSHSGKAGARTDSRRSNSEHPTWLSF